MAEPEIERAGRSSALVSNSQLENIKVAVRLRPFTEKEKQRDNRRIVDIEKNTVVLYNPKHEENGLKKFTFDHSYWSHDGFMKGTDGVNVPNYSHVNCNKYVGQEKVFDDLGKFLLSNALEGYNSALLAYGQTGSGKSYTVSGYGKNEGILPRFARTLFEELDSNLLGMSRQVNDESAVFSAGKRDNQINRYEIFFSMIEIYNEVVRDLLAKSANETNDQTSFLRRGLKVREHPKKGFFVENLTSHICTNKDVITRLIDQGQLNKSIAATSMNETSSRGHTIYEFKIKQYKLKSVESLDEVLTTSVVQLVDLAGSERLAVHVTGRIGEDSFLGSKSNLSLLSGNDTSINHSRNKVPKSASSNASSSQLVPPNHQRRFKESVSINQSLSALGNCIQVMSQYFQQPCTNQSKRNTLKIPYRDSVLTKLLNRCCLSGNSKVVIIATLSPVDSSYDDTLSTLRFADRAKQIRTHAIINRMSHNKIIEMNLKDNKSSRPMDGRITRSDDSSQNSNFDDMENLLENLTSRPSNKHNGASMDVVASPLRSRTTIRRGKIERKKKDKLASLGSSSSNPSLIVREQMKRLVSPVQKNINEPKGLVKKRGLRPSQTMQAIGTAEFNNRDEYIGDIEQDIYDIDDNFDIGGVNEDFVGPESEISSSDTSLKDLPNEDKIVIVNRMLSRSIGGHASNREDINSRLRSFRPKEASQNRERQNYLSSLNLELKRTNPYLSNLNEDEQLSGVITYLIKIGDTIVGKDDNCDVVLRGTELRPKHALVTRSPMNESEESPIFIEPLGEESQTPQNIAVKVNGSDVNSKTRIKHGDRIIFGTNSYFVLVDNNKSHKSDRVFDSSMISYEFAKNEVLQKMMSEDENGAMIKKINHYTHRPGTGKRRTNSPKKTEETSKPLSAGAYTPRITHILTMTDQELNDAESTDYILGSEGDTTKVEKEMKSLSDEKQDQDFELNEAKYRDKLLEDTYEFAIPVAEVNAIAKEMGIKINYSLKILTGEEQLPEQLSFSLGHSSASDRSSSLGEAIESDMERLGGATQNTKSVSHLDKLDALDRPPALFIRVHHEESEIDFYWSKEKFLARRYKIMELYGAWDSAGKSGLVEYLIDQSRIGSEYMVDPFWDDPSDTNVLIGHSQISLKPIAHLSGISLCFDILNLNDETCGKVSIEAIPCRQNEVKSADDSQVEYRPYTEKELEGIFLEEPQKLLKKRLVFLLKIISCSDIPEQFGNVFCQYSFSYDCTAIKTREIEIVESNTMESSKILQFNHCHYICFNEISEDALDFFEHGFLTIQVVGRYSYSKKGSNPQTVVTTIINSINKYKYKLEQDFYNGINDTNGSYYNSDSAHSNQVNPASLVNSNSGTSSVGSNSTTVNIFDQQQEDDDALNGLSQENVIDMILTKRKLDRAENQLQYLKRTINIAEHYNKKHIPIKTVKKLLNSYGQDLDEGSLEDLSNEGKFDNFPMLYLILFEFVQNSNEQKKGKVSTTRSKTSYNKQSGCTIQ